MQKSGLEGKLRYDVETLGLGYRLLAGHLRDDVFNRVSYHVSMKIFDGYNVFLSSSCLAFLQRYAL